jgi:hypothetical protein
MRCCRNFGFFLLMVALAACLTTSIAWGEDYASSSDRYKKMDRATGGMVKWLDQPVASSPSSASRVPSETNDLWVFGATNRTQYASISVGTSLVLVANAPTGGMGQFYKIFQTNNVSIEYKTLQLNPGKNEIGFKAEKAGRYMFYFVVNNLPSNVVIVDVFNQAAPLIRL